MTLYKVYWDVAASMCRTRMNVATFGTPAFVSRRAMTSSQMEEQVLHKVVNKKGILTLNRPKKLNALNRTSLDIIFQKLIEWEDKVNMVIIRGEGRAFCAGGDIVSNSRRGSENLQKSKEFFQLEYLANGLIGEYKVPYVAVMDGITMGGGAGLSVHGRVRIATERTVFAMPETRIGLFTDVGLGHVFSAMPYHLGHYLALIGHKLHGTDVVKAGIATHYVDSSNIQQLLNDLIDLDYPQQNLEKFLQKHTQDLSSTKFSLDPHLESIENTFSADSVEEIMQRLSKDGSDFTNEALKVMKQMSPTSLKLSKKLIDTYKGKTLQEGLAFDNRLSVAAVYCKISPDYYEGVRALLIDKDNTPIWKPATLEQVTDQLVEKAFAQLPSEEELNYATRIEQLRKQVHESRKINCNQ